MVEDIFRLTIDKEFTSPNQEKLRILKEIKENNYNRNPNREKRSSLAFPRKMHAMESPHMTSSKTQYFKPKEVEEAI